VFLTINSVIGGTSGHSRYVLAQLKLELLVSTTIVQWHQRLHELSHDERNTYDSRTEMLSFIEAFLKSGFEIVLEETKTWSANIQEALEQLHKAQQGKSGGKGGGHQ
jgi:hypothetical protein